jgi:hypothetical protein
LQARHTVSVGAQTRHVQGHSCLGGAFGAALALLCLVLFCLELRLLFRSAGASASAVALPLANTTARCTHPVPCYIGEPCSSGGALFQWWGGCSQASGVLHSSSWQSVWQAVG